MYCDVIKGVDGAIFTSFITISKINSNFKTNTMEPYR